MNYCLHNCTKFVITFSIEFESIVLKRFWPTTLFLITFSMFQNCGGKNLRKMWRRVCAHVSLATLAPLKGGLFQRSSSARWMPWLVQKNDKGVMTLSAADAAIKRYLCRIILLLASETPFKCAAVAREMLIWCTTTWYKSTIKGPAEKKKCSCLFTWHDSCTDHVRGTRHL